MSADKKTKSDSPAVSGSTSPLVEVRALVGITCEAGKERIRIEAGETGKIHKSSVKAFLSMGRDVIEVVGA